MKTAQRVFFFVVLTITYLLFTTPEAFAQTNSYAKPNTNPDVPLNLHTWSQNVMIEVLAAAGCQLTGFDPIQRKPTCLGVDEKTGKIGFVENGGGAIGLLSYAIGATFTKPMGTVDYVDYLASNFGVAKPAYAQTAGIGFSGLSPIINIWIAFRNIVYMVFIIVFVIVGVAIMLRVKIDPRTVMTIENQIPKIIFGLLLVTFSFAIAGFLVDLMWVAIYLTVSVLGPIGNTPATFLSKVATSTNPFQAMNEIGGANGNTGGLSFFITSPAASIAGMVKEVFQEPGIKGFMALFVGAFAAVMGQKSFLATAFKDIPFAGGLIGGFVGATLTYLFTEQLMSFLSGVIANVVIGIAVVWALFRLWFALLSAYIYILLDVVFAPFWIVGGVVPGSPMGFSAWLRSLLGNLLAFPATIGLFVLGALFMRAFNTTGVFVPPLVGNPATGITNPIGALIGLGIIFISPQVVAITKELIKAPQLKQGAAVGQPLAVGLGAINVPKHAQELGMKTYYLKQLAGIRAFQWLNPFLGRASGQD